MHTISDPLRLEPGDRIVVWLPNYRGEETAHTFEVGSVRAFARQHQLDEEALVARELERGNRLQFVFPLATVIAARSIGAERQHAEYIVRLGEIVVIEDELYRVEPNFNQNLKLVPLVEDTVP